MDALQLPPISRVPALATLERAAILDRLFEPCPQLHTLSVELLHDKTFISYDDLIASVGVQLAALADSISTTDKDWLDKILSAHPRLGEKKVDSTQSRVEQAHLDSGSEVESAELKTLNEEYEKKFPGLRYVVFVNGRPRSTIMQDMKERITRNDVRIERLEAIRAMCEIAADRASTILKGI